MRHVSRLAALPPDAGGPICESRGMKNLLGQRVSVRLATGGIGPSGGPEFTDVIGVVLDVGPESLRIERRDGSSCVVRRESVAACRVVPDRPIRRRRAQDVSVADLVRVTSRSWPAIESLPLGDWELRASGGFTRRANSVLADGAPAGDDPIAAVRAFYSSRGLQPLAQVVIDAPEEEQFFAAGWEPQDGHGLETLVQVADLDVLSLDPEVAISESASDVWLSRYARTGESVEDARAVLEGVPRVGFLSIDDRAIARVSVTGEWAGIAAIEVDPDHRGQGLARRLLTTALAWAGERGADKAFAQITPDNAASLALHADFGFGTHHAYRYLAPAR